MIKLIRIFLLLIIVASANKSALATSEISKINVVGNQRIEDETIQEYSALEINEIFSEEKKSQAIKLLYGSALFEDIKISQDHQGIVEITVKETPFVTKVQFEGNNKVKKELLEQEIETIAGDNLRKNKLKTDLAKIREIYRRTGYFAARVKVATEKQLNNRVKVTFNIEEGPKTGIKNIYFSGNEQYADNELKSVILTKENRWFRFLESNDTFDPSRIEYDKYLLKKFYNSVGFADFRIISATANLLPTREGFNVNFSIDEGEKYQFGEIKLLNKITNIDNNEILKFVPSYQGRVYNLNLIEKIIIKLNNYLTSEGYPQVQVKHEIERDISNKIIHVQIVIEQANLAFINHINIEGNVKTEDQVIRRQIKLAEGDIFNPKKIKAGERNIRNLDFFGKINIDIVPTKKEDKHDININVEEKSTASIGFETGYNSAARGFFGKIALVEKNFVGSGRVLDVGLNFSKKNRSLNFELTNPKFMNRDVNVGHSIFYKSSVKDKDDAKKAKNYDISSVGGNLSCNYRLADNLSHNVEYSLVSSNLKPPKEGIKSLFVKENEGNIITSSISHSLVLDQTDNFVLSRNGYALIFKQEFAGLGGNNKYLKNEIKLQSYKSFRNNKCTLKFSASGGIINGIFGKKVRISDRFNLGDQSLRGFASGGIGPRDKITKESLGGQKYCSLSTELSLPSGLPEEWNLHWNIFADIGSLWDMDSDITDANFYNKKSFRGSIGFGILWKTRIAPIKLDWGFPILKEDFDELQTFHVKFTTQV